MREAMFIKKNVEKWNQYQHEASKDPDETAERFTTLIDDLSYAKTFYPKSKVTKWLNGLAASIYQNVYQNKKEKYSRIFDFWKYELPFLFKKYHRIFLFTTISFVSFCIIGYLASIHNTDFIRSVMGDGYVDKTEELIASGDPFGIYKSENPFTMFVHIAYNNIRVAFLTFIGGFLLGVPSFFMLFKNGIMLGSFEAMFFSHGFGYKSILVIWIHGTIEISSIILAGTAALMIANSILFPGTYKRLESFKRGFKDATKVLICLIPFFILAAFLESYITHLMSQTFDGTSTVGLPIWASALILGSSLFLIVWYFVIWPIRLNKRGYFTKKEGLSGRLNII